LKGQSVGPFSPEFQKLSSGFIPDVFSASDLRLTSLLLGVAVALAMVVIAWRERANHQRHGMDVEPGGLFAVRNAAFAAILVALSWLMASYKGLPNVLIVMFVLMVGYDFVTTRMTIGRRLYALGGNEKAARLSGIKTERLAFLTFVNMGVLA